MEKDRLILEFMGWKNHVDMGSIQLFYKDDEVKHISGMNFNSSWDWLMPVVEKIESLGHGVTIYRKGCHINDIGVSSINGFTHSNKLEQTYKAVVEFIKWYNQTK